MAGSPHIPPADRDPAATRVVVPLVSADEPLGAQVDAALSGGADLIELRVDLIQEVEAIEALLRERRPVPYILTIRGVAEGGAWAADDAERIALYERLGLLLPGYVDVELALWERSANLRQKIGLVCDLSGAARSPLADLSRPRNRLILSHHDLRSTPAEPATVLERLAATPAHVLKAVFTACDTTDAVRVLSALRQNAARRPTIALAMGEAGLLTRVAAQKFGAFATFAALRRGAESAPGQPTLEELQRLYRWAGNDAQARLFGVVGWPVTHSLSPAIHNTAMAAAGVRGVYLPLPVRPSYEAFAAFMDAIHSEPRLEFAGLSVTSPHKEHSLRWLRESGGSLSALADRCGAVNTLTRQAGGWKGDNTDVAGVNAALATSRRLPAGSWEQLAAAVLGAGGVARAAVLALTGRGARVTVYGRTATRARRLAEEFGCGWAPWEARGRNQAQLLANCTPVGQHPYAAESPLESEWLRSEQVIFDTIYGPVRTPLLQCADQHGCETIGGLVMLIGQAAEQFLLWHGRDMPDVAMPGMLVD